MRIVRSPILWCFVLSLAAMPTGASAGEQKTADGYAFLVNGEPDWATICSLNGQSDRPAPGDVILLNVVALVLGEPAEYRFRATPYKDGRVVQIGPDGEEELVAVAVLRPRQAEPRDKGEPPTGVDGLTPLTPAQIHKLRGIFLDDWPDGTGERLQHIDRARCCITLCTGAVRDKTKSLPPLPTDLRYLCIDDRMFADLKDVSALTGLRDLRWLTFRPHGLKALDATMLREATELRYLNLAGLKVKNAEALAPLTALRELRLGWNKRLRSIAFVKGMKALRHLDIPRTRVRSLSPIADLPALGSVRADQTPIRKLPRRPVPALRRLRVLSSRLSDEAVARFRRAHPKCTVFHHWRDPLDHALGGVARLRLADGDALSSPRKAPALFETRDPGAIKEFVAKLTIDEEYSGDHCMCFGGPLLEFHGRRPGAEGGPADTLLAMISIHHGRGLRWPGGWIGDACLTGEAADFLCEWLAEHGAPGPKARRDHVKAEIAAAARRRERTMVLLPEALAQAVREAETDEEAVAAIQKAMPDPVQRATLCLKLYGCDNTPWHRYSVLDSEIESEVLRKLPPATLTEAIRRARDDPNGADGAARWLFGERKWTTLDPETRQELVPAITRRAIAHPRKVNRWITLCELGEMGGEEAVRLLRAALAGTIEPRRLPRGEEAEPLGATFSRGRSVSEECSERAIAACMLLRLGDRESLAAVRALAQQAKGEDKEALDKALRRFLPQHGERGRPDAPRRRQPQPTPD